MSTFWFPLFKLCWSTSTKWETESTKWVTKQQVGRPRINQGGRANYMVFLENKSDHRVKCSAKFSLKDHEKNLEAHYYQAQDTWGLGEFVSHDTIEWNSLLDEEDDRFTLQVEVDLMEEEVLATRPREIQGSAVARLQKEVSDLREAISNVHNEMAKISTLLVGKIEELQRGMESKRKWILLSVS